MKTLDDDVLIKIFKYLNLKSRFEASGRCKRWNRLLTDPRAHIDGMNDISISDGQNDDQEINEEKIRNLQVLFSHVRHCKKLSLSNLKSDRVNRVSELISS